MLPINGNEAGAVVQFSLQQKQLHVSLKILFWLSTGWTKNHKPDKTHMKPISWEFKCLQ
jgi:hypothetical protein